LIRGIVEYPGEFSGGGVSCRIALAFSLRLLQQQRPRRRPGRPSPCARGSVPACGATDILARIIAERISGRSGNRSWSKIAGAAGNVGTEMVARSPADGYTILQATAAQAISETLYTKRTFSFENDLAATAMIAACRTSCS